MRPVADRGASRWLVLAVVVVEQEAVIDVGNKRNEPAIRKAERPYLDLNVKRADGAIIVVERDCRQVRSGRDRLRNHDVDPKVIAFPRYECRRPTAPRCVTGDQDVKWIWIPFGRMEVSDVPPRVVVVFDREHAIDLNGPGVHQTRVGPEFIYDKTRRGNQGWCGFKGELEADGLVDCREQLDFRPACSCR